MDQREFYLFKKIDESLLKIFVIVFLTLFLLIVAYSGLQLFLGNITQMGVYVHMSMGILVLLLMLVHMINKKNKIKKLSEEFVNILLKRNIKHLSNKEILLDEIRSKSLKEVSSNFNMETKKMIQLLALENIQINSEEDKIKEIAKNNQKDIYQFFILMLRIHMQMPSPKG